MDKTTQIVHKYLGYFPNYYLVICHYFWTRNATKSIKTTQDTRYSLESNKTLSHEIDSIGRLPGDDDVTQT